MNAHHFANKCQPQHFYTKNNVDELKHDTNTVKDNRQNRFLLSRKKSSFKPLISMTTVSIVNDRVSWRPYFHTICKDQLLLNALIEFMTQCYNSENILFLQSVTQLNNTTEDNMNAAIVSIYNSYIVSSADHQINLSSLCTVDILCKRTRFHTFDHDTKCCMFNVCVQEIKRLIISSVLPSFYRSETFQYIARQSIHYTLACDNSYSDAKMKVFTPRSTGSSPSEIDTTLTYTLRADHTRTESKLKAYRVRRVNAIESISSPVSLSSSSTSTNLLRNSETELSQELDICADYD